MDINNSEILLVFQAPGIDEWTGNSGTTRRAPIISEKPRSAAARLRNSFNRVKKQRINFDITETVQCYPGKKSNGRDKSPLKTAIQCCKNNLKKDIMSKKYKKIISFGKVAQNVVDEIIKSQNITVVHMMLPHPSSMRLPNSMLDSAFK